MTEIIVVGAGGFGREVLDVIDAINQRSPSAWTVRGVADDRPSDVNLDRLRARGVAYLGTSDVVRAAGDTCHYVIGVGDPSTRRRIASAFDQRGFSAATLIHPTVTCGFDVSFGEGSVVCAGAILTTNVHAGRHLHLNPSVTVGHDTTLGEFVSVNPHASISGDCVIGDDVLIGVAAVVLNQLSVGSGAVIGGAACVVRDVPSGVIVKGVPAR